LFLDETSKSLILWRLPGLHCQSTES